MSRAIKTSRQVGPPRPAVSSRRRHHLVVGSFSRTFCVRQKAKKNNNQREKERAKSANPPDSPGCGVRHHRFLTRRRVEVFSNVTFFAVSAAAAANGLLRHLYSPLLCGDVKIKSLFCVMRKRFRSADCVTQTSLAVCWR